MSLLIEQLNQEQQQAVTATDGHYLVLAGAGSGKTRVLVQRIAWLIENHGLSPFNILAVTFTNKAANEMRQRIEHILGRSTRGMWVGTFHGLSHQLLRKHWQAANLPETFQILDSDDQLRIIKRLQKQMNIDEDRWSPKQTQGFINRQKQQGIRATQVAAHDFYTETLRDIYRNYENICQQSGLVDFAELLVRALDLLQAHPEIAEHYQQRFQHVLVDEFQDTNAIQYRWLKAFAGKHAFVMAVGDDDQSIYSWRGAQVENLLHFQQEFQPHIIRLEQNYRSTQKILDAANAVIAKNENRMGKKLWTEGDIGEPIILYAAFNERDEASFVVSSIRDYLKQDVSYNEIAILYRSNAQSRILEEQLIDAGLPYRIYGGQKFFERMEIKDALAYLRLMINRYDDASFERIINTPTRGIGNTTLNKIRAHARDQHTTLWQAAQDLIAHEELSGRSRNALQSFVMLIDQLEQESKDLEFAAQAELMLKRSGLLAHYENDRSEVGISRVENLEELLTAIQQFKVNADETTLSPMSAFLAQVTLESGENQADQHSASISLMTLHSAKGLEFSYVYIVGLEEGLFPHMMSMENPQGLEEERRLCYVGMTRAMQRLHLSYAESRRLHGSERYNVPSRFLQEIPAELLHAVRPSLQIKKAIPASHYFKPAPKQQPVGSGLHLGDRVRHKKFGMGTIINAEGQGAHARVQIQFDQFGTKWLVLNFASLVKV